MWVRLLCVLVATDTVVVSLRIYEVDHDQVQANKSVAGDQEGSASALLSTRQPQHSFGVKIEHPLGEDLHGRVVEQREQHEYGSQHQFQPSQTNHAGAGDLRVGGEWKGISRFKDHQDQQSHDLNQHQVLGQVLQGLGKVNQILGTNHQDIEQVNQIFRQGHHQEYQKHNSFTSGDREIYSLGPDPNQEEHKNLVDSNQEVSFVKTKGDINNLVNNQDFKTYDLGSGFKSEDELNYLNFPKPSEQIQVKIQGVNTGTVTKEVAVPYTIEVEKRVPVKVEVPVGKPVPVPHPVYLENKVPYKVKESVAPPYGVFRRVPYVVRVRLNKPHPVHVTKPYRVVVEKRIPHLVDKHLMRLYPVFRTLPYPTDKRMVGEKLYPVPVPKVYVGKKVAHTAHVPVHHHRQPEVEGSGQDQGAGTLELQNHDQHWREYVPYPYPVHTTMYRQEVEGSRQSPGTTDLQKYQWRQHVEESGLPPTTDHRREPEPELVPAHWSEQAPLYL